MCENSFMENSCIGETTLTFEFSATDHSLVVTISTPFFAPIVSNCNSIEAIYIQYYIVVLVVFIIIPNQQLQS